MTQQKLATAEPLANVPDMHRPHEVSVRLVHT